MIEVMVTFGLLTIVLTALVAVINNQLMGEGRLDRRVAGAQALASTAVTLQGFGFQQLTTICGSQPARLVTAPTSAPPVSGKCRALLAPGAGAQATPSPSAVSLLLEVRRAFTGEVSPIGPVCLEINQCQKLALEALLDVTLTAYWADTNPTAPLQQASLHFRTTQW